jgi:hypothetical protein
MSNFLENFGGQALLDGANTSALRTMKSGLAQVAGASLHTKINKDGNETYSVKVSFNALAKGQDGITGFIRSSRANDLFKTMNKYVYMFKHENNVEANELFAQIGNPFKAYKTKVVVGTEVIDGVEVDITEEHDLKIVDLKTELEPLRLQYGESLDFIYLNEDKDYSAVAVEVINAKDYCEKLVTAINVLVDSECIYSLKIVEGKRNFSEIQTITKANI